MVEALLDGGKVLGRDEVALTMLDSAVRAVAEFVAVGVRDVTLFGVVLGTLAAPLDVESAEERAEERGPLLVDAAEATAMLDVTEVSEVLTDGADAVLMVV